MTLESDNSPARGVVMTFKGLNVARGGGLWADVEVISTHRVTVDNLGSFKITIPHNRKIDRFSLEARTSAGGSVYIRSDCPDWACENLVAGTKNQMTLKVNF